MANPMQMLREHRRLVVGFCIVLLLSVIVLTAIYWPWKQACRMPRTDDVPTNVSSKLMPIVTRDFKNIALFQAYIDFPSDDHYIPLELRQISFDMKQSTRKTQYDIILTNYCAELTLSLLQATNSTKMELFLTILHNIYGHKQDLYCDSDQFGVELDINRRFDCDDFLIDCSAGDVRAEINVQKLEFEILGDPEQISQGKFGKPAMKCKK